MTSDRARLSYDPSRRYHGVIAQQGRVSLEADWNEAGAIAAAEVKARTLDLVGRAGSPDRGYHVTPVLDGDQSAGDQQTGDQPAGDQQSGDQPAGDQPTGSQPTGDLVIGAGTIYLGGQRLHAARDLRYGDQPDWADRDGDPLWRDPAVPEQPHELLYLLAREQEVGAVEDPALRDVALGGPDTTQRLRLVRRLIRYPTAARTWEDAWGQLVGQQWRPRGFVVDEATRSLRPAARLQVTGHLGDGAEQPADHGGYLGPNNQLIRVQVARVDDDGVPVLVWGYDNASFLYRLSSAAPSGHRTILRLATAPVDAYHQPREHQAVEVLRSAALLAGGDYAAAPAGLVTRVAVAYDPDSREIAVDAELPPQYLKKPAEGLPLFLRVWEGEVRCTPGEEHQLGGSGVRVRLTGLPDQDGPDGPDGDGAERYPVGAYWMIAVRPGVGQDAKGLVYPQRIVDEPQPPDGPRQWLTPVAFVRWRPGAPRAEDCVPRFGRLTGEERAAGSSTVQLRPEEVGGGWGLQDAIDAHAHRGRQATICLAPGTYLLPRPLRIGPRHGRLTIRAVAPGVILRAEPQAAERFLLGMIIATEADGLSLQGIEVHPAHTRFYLDRETYLNLPERASLLLDGHRSRVVSIGLHAARCTGLSVDDCRFVFSLPEPGGRGGPGGRGEHPRHEELFGAGIFGAEEVRGLRVTRCTFASSEPLRHARRPRAGEDTGAAGDRHHLAVGVVHVPAALAVPLPEPGRDGEPRDEARPRGSLSLPLLDDAVLDGNTFARLTAAMVAIGQLGDIRVERNTVRDCHAGFWLVTQHASHVLTLLDRLVNQAEAAYRDLVTAGLSVLTEPLLFHATTLARALPLAITEDGRPDDERPEEGRPTDRQDAWRARRLEPPSTADERDASELFHLLSTAEAAGAAEAAGSVRDRPPAPAQREGWLRRFLDTFGRARTTRARPERVAVPEGAALRCELSIAGNVIGTGDAPGLVLLDAARDGAASLVLTGNQLRGGPCPGAAACLYLLRSGAVTANVIVNTEAEEEEDAAGSLVLLARRRRGRHQAAVTGNVLVGRARLPHRPDELPGWESLNSVTR